tara:strand:+ start:27651 stop:28229 length:579 start_codon:yes stop_codon:yes gene_type:complete
MKKQFLFIICSIAFTFNACSQKLTKSEALKIIKANNIIQDCYCEINVTTRSTWKSYESDLRAINELKKQGIITSSSYKDRLSKLDRKGHTVVKIHPLERATYEYGFEKRPMGFGGEKAKVLYSKASVSRVLGISLSNNDKEAKVLIEIQYDLSPFAGLVGKKSFPNQCHYNQIEEKEITLIKYDTGWRIKKY